MKPKLPELSWMMVISVFVLTVSIGFIGLVGIAFVEGDTTALWFIFGAILAVGLALLGGQAAYLGEIVDLLREIRDGLTDDRMQRDLGDLDG